MHRFEIKHCNCWNELKRNNGVYVLKWTKKKRWCLWEYTKEEGNRKKALPSESSDCLAIRSPFRWSWEIICLGHDPWPTWLTQTQSYTQTQAYPCTDLAHKHIRPHKHIGPHRYIEQDQFTEFYSLLYIISFDRYLSICPFLNKRFEEKSPVSPKFSTDICLLSWTTVSQINPCWLGNSSGHLRP